MSGRRLLYAGVYGLIVGIVWAVMGNDAAIAGAVSGGIGYWAGWGRLMDDATERADDSGGTDPPRRALVG